MATTISPVQPTDLEDCVELTHASKLSLSINRLLWNDWPATSAQKFVCRRAIEASIGTGNNPRVLKAVDPKTGKLVGSLTLSRRGKNTTREENAEEGGKENEKEEVDWPKELNMGVLEMVNWAVGVCAEPTKELDHIGMSQNLSWFVSS